MDYTVLMLDGLDAIYTARQAANQAARQRWGLEETETGLLLLVPALRRHVVFGAAAAAVEKTARKLGVVTVPAACRGQWVVIAPATLNALKARSR